MAKKPRTPKAAPPPRWYRGADVPMAVIRRFARQVAERFQPEKIILFGSYAYGTPHADSDVDILVVMPARNQLDQAVRIRWKVPAPFPMDLIVRTPKNLQWRLDEEGYIGLPAGPGLGVEIDEKTLEAEAKKPQKYKWPGAKLKDGSEFGSGGIEIDKTAPESPRSVHVIAEIPNLFGPGFTAQMTYYENAAGAKVFAAGAFTLAGSVLDDPVVSRLVANLFRHLSQP